MKRHDFFVDKRLAFLGLVVSIYIGILGCNLIFMSDKILGVALAFASLVSFVFLVSLLMISAPLVTLTDDGIYIRNAGHYKWQEIESIYRTSISADFFVSMLRIKPCSEALKTKGLAPSCTLAFPPLMKVNRKLLIKLLEELWGQKVR